MTEKKEPKGFVEVADAYPEEITILLRINMTGLTNLLEYLDRCVFDNEMHEVQMTEEAVRFVQEDFFKGLDAWSDTMKGKKDGS